MIDLFVKRSLLENKKLFLSMNILFVLTIILFTLSMYANFYGKPNYKEYAKNTNLEDFQMQTYEPLTNYEIDTIEQSYNMTLQKSQKYVYKAGDDIQVTIFPQNKMTDISHPIITQGRGIQNSSEIVISQEFAKANELKLNENISISNKDFEIVGFASFPYLMYPTQDGGLFPDNKNVGQVYVSKEDFAKIKNPTNYYLGKFNENISKTKREEIYNKIKEEDLVQVPNLNILGLPTKGQSSISNVVYLLDKEDNLQINIINLEYQFLGVIIGGLSILIGVITIVLISFIFESLIKKKKREIGIIRAQGYYQSEFEKSFSKYFSYGLILSILIGIILGVLLSIGLEGVYKNFFNIIYYKPDAMLFIVLIIGAIIIFLILNYFLHLIIKNKINKDILILISNVDLENDKKFKRSKKTKNKKQKSKRIIKTKFSTRMKINTMIRNKGKTLLLVYGVFFSSFLFIFGFSAIESFLNMEQNIRGDYFSYDYEVTYSPGYTPGVIFDDQNTTISFYGDVDENDRSISEDKVKVMGIENDNEYIDLGENLEGNEAIITSSMQKNQNLEIGDKIDVVNPKNKEEYYEFVVKDIIDVEYEDTLFASKDYLKKEFGLDDNFYNGLVGRGKTRQEVIKDDKNATFYSYDDLLDGIQKYSKMSSIGIIYIAVISGIIALITMTSIASIIIESQRKQISIMKVFGYTPLEINKLTFSMYKWVVLVIYVIAYPLSIKFIEIYIDFIMNLIPNMNYPLVIKSSLKQFLIGLIFIFLIYYLSSMLSFKKIQRISLSESLNKDE